MGAAAGLAAVLVLAFGGVYRAASGASWRLPAAPDARRPIPAEPVDDGPPLASALDSGGGDSVPTGLEPRPRPASRPEPDPEAGFPEPLTPAPKAAQAARKAAPRPVVRRAFRVMKRLGGSGLTLQQSFDGSGAQTSAAQGAAEAPERAAAGAEAAGAPSGAASPAPRRAMRSVSRTSGASGPAPSAAAGEEAASEEE